MLCGGLGEADIRELSGQSALIDMSLIWRLVSKLFSPKSLFSRYCYQVNREKLPPHLVAVVQSELLYLRRPLASTNPRRTLDGGGVDAVMITENGNSGVSIMCVCARAHAAHSQSGYFLCSRELCIRPTNGGGVDSLSLWETWIIAAPTVSSPF